MQETGGKKYIHPPDKPRYKLLIRSVDDESAELKQSTGS